MQEILDLYYNTNRPVVKLDHIFKGCAALIDTGASFPVWTKDIALLQALGATLIKENVNFGGFGGTAYGDIYQITLKLNNLIYPNMHIIACTNDNIPGYFIFSATMFQGTVYTVDDISKKFIIDVSDNQACRNLKILDSSGDIHILINS